MRAALNSQCSWLRGAEPAALFAIAALAGLFLAPLEARADWESEYHESNTYWGLSGNLVVPSIGGTIGQADNRPYLGVSDVSSANGGMSIFFGYRVHPYVAFEVVADWFHALKFDSLSDGRQNIDVFTGAIAFKGYPLAKLLDTVIDGRVQPYAYFAPGVGGAAGTTIQTPINFSLAVGGGVDVWINTSWSVRVDAKHNWSFGNIEGLDFTTIGFGGAYHF
jgi:hypothetical protein